MFTVCAESAGVGAMNATSKTAQRQYLRVSSIFSFPNVDGLRTTENGIRFSKRAWQLRGLKFLADGSRRVEEEESLR